MQGYICYCFIEGAKDMVKKLLKAYAAVVVIAFLFLAFIRFDFTTYVFQDKEEPAAELFTGLEIVEQTEDEIELYGTFPERELGNECLGFLTYHEEVRVFAAGGLAYSLNHGSNRFGSTTGQVWNFVNLRTNYANQPVTIRIKGIYGKPEVPQIYIGSKLSLYMMIIKDYVVSYTICVLTLLLGIVMLIYWFYVRSKTYIGGKLLYLGIFSILLGLWSMNEVPINILVLQNHVVSTYLAFISLMLLPVPFLLFVKNIYEDEDGWGWNITIILSLLNVVAGIVLQAADIMDMKYTLRFTHVVLALTALTLIYYTIRAVRKGEMNRNIKINSYCIILDVAASGVDIFYYYFMTQRFDGNRFGRLAFFIHIVLLGWVASRESTILMKKGREAAIYEKLAYRDQLTELYNRTAFEEDMEKLDDQKEETLIIMMDLNDLKKCNDTLGHDAGDRYIKNAATMINKVFHDVGKCYRIGGDEFCAVLKTGEVNAQKSFLVELEKLEQEYNQKSDEEKIAIAYGYACFDGSRDEQLIDTRNRADAMMYENKKQMKARG